jgi:hypothetical protein
MCFTFAINFTKEMAVAIIHPGAVTCMETILFFARVSLWAW